MGVCFSDLDPSKVCVHLLGLPFLLIKGAFKASSGIVYWCRSSYGTDFDNPEVASPESRLEDFRHGFKMIGLLPGCIDL